MHLSNVDIFENEATFDDQVDSFQFLDAIDSKQDMCAPSLIAGYYCVCKIILCIIFTLQRGAIITTQIDH